MKNVEIYLLTLS